MVGIVIANNAGAILEANDTFLDLIGYTRADLEEGRIDWRRLTPDEWLRLDERAIAEMAAVGIITGSEKEYVRKDGSRVPVSLGGAHGRRDRRRADLLHRRPLADTGRRGGAAAQ